MEVASDRFARRSTAIIRIRMENEPFAQQAVSEEWSPTWFIGICDGCAGFGHNTLCENEVADLNSSIPLRLKPRLWVTDHLRPAVDLAGQVPGRDPQPGQVLNLPWRNQLRHLALLSGGWTGNVGPDTVHFAGTHVFAPEQPGGYRSGETERAT